MNPNSESKFHYTKGGLSALIGIIKEGFRVKYCREVNPIMFSNLPTLGPAEPARELVLDYSSGFSSKFYPKFDWLMIPMVCFCDIPRRNISRHIDVYGFLNTKNGVKIAYGIGMSQDWAAKVNLRQVSYEYSQNKAASDYRSAYKAANRDSLTIKHPYDNHLDVEKYSSPSSIEGQYPLIKDNKGNEFPYDFLLKKPAEIKQIVPIREESTINFRAENEWRYIPQDACIISYYTFHNSSLHYHYHRSVYSNMEKALSEAPTYDNLKFSLNDIDFVIVGSKEEKKELRESLKALAEEMNWGQEQLEELFSKFESYYDILHN